MTTLLHVHIGAPRRQLDGVEAVDETVVSRSQQNWIFIFRDKSGLRLEGLGIAESTLLLAIASAQAVGSRAACVSLAGGDEVSQVLVKVLHFRVRPVTDVGVGLGGWSFIHIAPIWQDSRVAGADYLVHILDECFLGSCRTLFGVGKSLLHIRCIRKPGEAVDMRAAAMLPLKSEPVVAGTKDSGVEGIDELDDAVIEEPVSDGGVLLDCLVASRVGVGIFRTDEACQFRPLKICCAVSEEHCGQTERVHHGNEASSLLEPVVPRSS